MEATGEEAEQFRREIGLLHHRLEGYELNAGKGADKRRVTFTNVFLKERPPGVFNSSAPFRGYEFRIERRQSNEVSIEVRRTNGNRTVVFSFLQSKYNIGELEALPAFQALTVNAQSYLRQVYPKASPSWFENLTTFRDTDPNTRKIKCGAHTFYCGREALFAGVVEIVYRMRCTLFHGEIAPTKDAIGCYEPAFRLVRRFVDCVM